MQYQVHYSFEMGLKAADRGQEEKESSRENVRALFAQMAPTYDLLSKLLSFGFTERWRRDCLGHAEIEPGMRVADLMCGTGLAWADLAKHARGGQISAFDYSSAMLEQAEKLGRGSLAVPVLMEKRDVTRAFAPRGSFDRIVCSFGLKTLESEQAQQFASNVYNALAPGGIASFVELSVPSNCLMYLALNFYLKFLVPPIVWLLGGNARAYSFLEHFTFRFKPKEFILDLEKAGFEVEVHHKDFKLATVFVVRKPESL